MSIFNRFAEGITNFPDKVVNAKQQPFNSGIQKQNSHIILYCPATQATMCHNAPCSCRPLTCCRIDSQERQGASKVSEAALQHEREGGKKEKGMQVGNFEEREEECCA
jgi:hypothetical protein